MTLDLTVIFQTILGSILTASVVWIAARVQTMTTQVAILITQVQDLREQVISREFLEKEIANLNSKCNKLEFDLNNLFQAFRKVEIEHNSCSNCKK